MPPTFDDLAPVLRELAIRTTVLLALAAILVAAVRRAPAALRHRIGSVALAGALTLPALTLWLPRLDLRVLPPQRSASKERVTITSASADRARDLDESGRIMDVGYGVVVAAGPGPREEAAAPLNGTRSESGRWPAVLLTIWAAGAAALLLRLLVGAVRVRRYSRNSHPAGSDWTELARETAARLGLRRPVRLALTTKVTVAVTSGLWRPVLLLPESAERWPVERRRVVLLHEMAHVARRDWPALLLSEVAVALYWPHPLVHLVARQVRSAAEKASDDLVLAAGTKPSVYAGHLLAIVRALSPARWPVLAALPVARPSSFESRLRAILDPAPARRAATHREMRVAAAALAVGVLALAAVELKPARAEAVALAGGTASGFVPRAGDDPPAAHDEGSCEKSKARAKASEAAARRDVAAADAGEELRAGEGVEPPAKPEEPAYVPAIRRETGVAAPEGFTRAGRQAGKSGEDWYDRAYEAYHDERYEEAAEAFQRAAELGYREGTASYNAACSHALLQDRDRAFDWLRKAMDAGFDLASYLGRDDDLDSLRSDPRFRELTQAARASRSNSKRREAERLVQKYERLAASQPEDGGGFFDLGSALLKAGEHARAAEAFQRSASLGYRQATSLYNTACGLSLAGNTPGALEHLEKSLEAGFDNTDLIRKDDDLDNIRGEARFGELQKMAKDLALPGIARRAWNKVNRSRREQREEWRAAAADFEAYARAHPKLGRAWFNAGFARIEGEEPAAAAEDFRRALDLQYRPATTMYNLACSYSLLDQKDEAFRWLFRSLGTGFHGGMLDHDSDLDNLRDDPRFREARAMVKARHKDED